VRKLIMGLMLAGLMLLAKAVSASAHNFTLGNCPDGLTLFHSHEHPDIDRNGDGFLCRVPTVGQIVRGVFVDNGVAFAPSRR